MLPVNIARSGPAYVIYIAALLKVEKLKPYGKAKENLFHNFY